jgi:hypothetical protein
MSHLLLSNPIPKPITNNGKKDVFEVVPHIEVVNHLGVGFFVIKLADYHSTRTRFSKE